MEATSAEVFGNQVLGTGSGCAAHASAEEKVVTRRSRWVAGRLGVERRAAERVDPFAQRQPQQAERHVRIQSGGQLVSRMLADAGQQHGKCTGRRQVAGHASAATGPAATGATAGRRRRHAVMR